MITKVVVAIAATSLRDHGERRATLRFKGRVGEILDWLPPRQGAGEQ
jgi:hypothetical protein